MRSTRAMEPTYAARGTAGRDRAAVPINVVMATRGRPASALRAVRSILAARYPSFRLIVVDQSENGATLAVLQPVVRDPRLTLVDTPGRGLAAARNLGVDRSTSPLVAFTDDECEVTPGWLGALAAAFAADPGLGMVYGTVEATPYDRSAGFIPAYRVERARTARSLADKPRIEGIGANMAVRRTVLTTVGGFDEILGAGAPLAAGEDTDLAIRMLAAGYHVHETPAAVVVHHGFRRWNEAEAAVAGRMTGLGAANAKMLRLAGRRAARPLAALAWRWLKGTPVVDRDHRPPRLARLRAFTLGLWTGLWQPLDRRSGCFYHAPDALRRVAPETIQFAGRPGRKGTRRRATTGARGDDAHDTADSD